MDQKKIGCFLKELRKEKGVTQEQLAETLGVSGRTVSRWETGFNMPDLDVLIQIADYSNEEKKKLSRRMCILFSAGAVLFTFYVVAEMCFEGVHNELLDFCEGFTLGFSYSVMIGGILYTSGCLAKLQAFKKRIMGK